MEKFLVLSPFQTGVIIIAGPVADLLFTVVCAATWPLTAEPVGVGIAAGAAARWVVWLLNIIPIPALGNNGARIMELVWKRAA